MNRAATDESPKDVAALREAQAGVVHGVYRLVKACLFHTDASNDAVTQLVTGAVTSVRELCRIAATDHVVITFLGDAVFVNGQILKASRDTHALAADLGELLAPGGATELTILQSVTGEAIGALAKLLADIQRDRSHAPRLLENPIPGIKAGKASFGGGAGERDQSPAARAARTFAASILAVQKVFVELRDGKFELPRRIKRVAQKIVAHADEDTRLLVALAAGGGAKVDAAAIAVSSAILAVAMTRQLTTERGMLTNVAMATLLYDAGRLGAGAATRTLNDDELDRIPARSVVTLTAIGRLHAPARARTALVYEVWSQRRAHRIGPPYKGRRPPTLLARIIAVARAFSEIRAAGTDAALGIDDAIQVLQNRAADGTDRALVKLVVGALGVYPAGTMVELNTGELGVVMATPALPVDYVRPPVKILYDEHAILLEPPIDLDLAAARAEGEPLRFIRKSVDADDSQAKAMRAYVIAATAAKRRAQLDPEEAAASAAGVPSSASRRMPGSQRHEPTPASRGVIAPPSSNDKPIAGRAVANDPRERTPSAMRVALPPPPATRTQEGTQVSRGIVPPQKILSRSAIPRIDVDSNAPPPKINVIAGSLSDSAGADRPTAPVPKPQARLPAIEPPTISAPPESAAKPVPESSPRPPPSSARRPPPPHLADPISRRKLEARPISRTDSEPPSMQEEVVGRRAPISRVEPTDGTTGAPPSSKPAMRPPPSTPSMPPMSSNDPSPEPPEATRQVSWTSYVAMVDGNPDATPTIRPADRAAPAPPSQAGPRPARQPVDIPRAKEQEEEEPPKSAHDDLLAAFLADEPPPEEPQK